MSEVVPNVIKTLINNEVKERTSKYVEQISFLTSGGDQGLFLSSWFHIEQKEQFIKHVQL